MAISAPERVYSSIQVEAVRSLTGPGSYRVELPLDLLDEDGTTIDWLIGFTFDTLHAHHLDLRIVASPQSPANNPQSPGSNRQSPVVVRDRQLLTANC